MSFFYLIWDEMTIGNFSFPIFVMSVLQTILMVITLIFTIRRGRNNLSRQLSWLQRRILNPEAGVQTSHGIPIIYSVSLVGKTSGLHPEDHRFESYTEYQIYAVVV